MYSPKKKSLFVCVGDPSADAYVAKLASSLKQRFPDLHVWGMGGTAMKNCGAELLFNRAARATFGIFEVLRDVPELAQIRSKLLSEIKQRSPDAVLLVDFSGFNLTFANLIRKQNKDLQILYFIAPQVWASRPWRIKALAKSVNKVLVIFPFEESLYKSNGLEARFVGHPLTLTLGVGEQYSREEFCSKHSLQQDKPIVGVFPGSRRGEIRSHAEPILSAITWLKEKRPDLQFVVPAANDLVLKELTAQIKRHEDSDSLQDAIKIISGSDNYELMVHSKLIWAKSGTTTLEATLAGKPMIIFYRGLWLSYIVMLLFLRVKYVGWPNLLNGKQIVPELLQLDCRAELLVRNTLDLLDVPGLMEEMTDGLKRLRNHLGQGNFLDGVAQELILTFEKA